MSPAITADGSDDTDGGPGRSAATNGTTPPGPGAEREPKADAAAWTAVAAGTIGALMATLDTSIVNTALPTIQGEIGASGSDGTWISTAYLVAEIVMIPMAGWLERALGLRTLLLIVASLFTVCSVGCGFATSLSEMIIGRIGQGFTGGAMIPTALSIVAQRLPISQRPIGVALFGMTAVMGPVLGPMMGGWLTVHVSWHYVFFINVPIGLGLVIMVFSALPAGRGNLAEFRRVDVLGIAGLIFGLGGLTTLLEEGQRELWFQSAMIRELALVTLVGFAMLIGGQFVARSPVVQLRILLQASFAGVFVMSLVLGAALYGILYLIPQYLTLVAGYDGEQSGYIAAIGGIGTMALLPTFPFMVKHVDMRIAVAFGLLVYSFSCYIETTLTPASVGSSFVWGQLLRGIAMFFTLIFLNQAAADSVARKFVDDASGLFNAARNLGGSFGLAAIATLQARRIDLHYARLAESMHANAPLVQAALHRLGRAGIGQDLLLQATVMSYSDLYWLYSVILLATIPLVFLLKPVKQTDDPGAASGMA